MPKRTEDDLATLLNIGPVSARHLREVGIGSAAAVRRLGAVAVYQRVKHAFPRETSLNLLYALEGAIRGCPWNRLPPGVKEKLKSAANAR